MEKKQKKKFIQDKRTRENLCKEEGEEKKSQALAKKKKIPAQAMGKKQKSNRRINCKFPLLSAVDKQ